MIGEYFFFFSENQTCLSLISLLRIELLSNPVEQFVFPLTLVISKSTIFTHVECEFFSKQLIIQSVDNFGSAIFLWFCIQIQNMLISHSEESSESLRRVVRRIILAIIKFPSFVTREISNLGVFIDKYAGLIFFLIKSNGTSRNVNDSCISVYLLLLKHKICLLTHARRSLDYLKANSNFSYFLFARA